jgi:hypothetical protein
VPRSVAPSGTPALLADPDDPSVPAVPDPVPAPVLLADVDPQLLDCAEPPPSKAAFELALGQGVISGLTPGVLMPVAPSGMLPPVRFEPDELSDDMPSGEVAPMPGVVLVCACAATTPIDQIMKASGKSGYRITTSLSSAKVSLQRFFGSRMLKAQSFSLCGNQAPPFCPSEHGGSGTCSDVIKGMCRNGAILSKVSSARHQLKPRT